MKLKQLALACALTGSLAACGGGGSDAGVQKDRTLSGVAAKGLIKNGVVKVYSYSAGKKSASIATTTTDSEGRYSVKIGNNTGLLIVEVGADDNTKNTKMYDEATKLDITMPTNMVLRSLVQFDNTAIEKITAHVTPFTDMVVTVAEKRGGLNPVNAESAQNSVAGFLKFDPRLTKPIMAGNANANNTADEKSQSLRLATLSEIANDTTSADSLGCTEAEAGDRIECVVKATMGSTDIKDGIIDMSQEANNAAKTAFETVLANPDNAEIVKEVAHTFSEPVKVPATAAVVGSIDAAKALFNSLRSNINAWSATAKTGGALNNQAEALKADFDTAIAPLDEDLADWILLSGRGMTLFNEFKNANVGPYVPNSAPTYSPISQSDSGNCQVYADTTADTPAKISSDAKSVFCRLNATMVAGTYERNAGGSTWKQFTKTILLTPVAGTTSSFSYESRARMETVQSGDVVTVTKTTIGAYGPTDRANGTVSYTMNGNIETGATINGFMPARTDDMGVAITDQESWNVSYVSIPEAGGVNKYAFSGNIKALKGGVEVGSVTLQDGSYIRTVSPVGNYEINSEVNLVLSVAAGKSKVTGTLSLNKFSADINGSNYIPTDLKFIGSFTNASSEFFEGTLTAKTTNYAAYDNSQPRSTANFSPTSGSFVGILRIPARKDLKLTLNASNPELDKANFNAQYDDGTNTVQIDSTNASPKVINISSANGVSLQLKEGFNTADVMRNSSIIATINRSTGMIDYADGSGESLK